MAVLTLAQFLDKLRIQSYAFDLGENLISSRAGSGAVLVSSLGAGLWEGSNQCTSYTHDGQRELEAYLASIRVAGTFFEFCPPKGQYPINDPTGALLGTSSVILTGVTSGYGVNLSGLPAGYKITAGDYFSWSSGGINRLHQFAASGVASAGGTLSLQMVNPFRVNALPANNAAVTLKRPRQTCRYIPSSRKAGMVDLGHSTGSGFNFIQATQL